MRSLAFLLSRRWALFALAVALLASLAWWLGQWQFHRLEDRRERNEITAANEARDAVPVTEVLAPGSSVPDEDEWRLVTAVGRYDVTDTVIVRYRTREGSSGVDVVVPLLLEDGGAVLVDRGWLEADNVGASPDDIPAPPGGRVTVTGWVRRDATGDATRVTEQSTRAISSVAIGAALDREVFGGFLDLKTEDPPAAQPLLANEPPELGSGPHFFYGLQWWFFGLLAIFGFCYLLWDEWRKAREGSPRPPRMT